MTNVTASQMARFDTLAEQGFVRRLEAHLLEHHAEAVGTIPPHQFKRCVAASLVRARSHGFTWEASLTAFAVMMFEIGPGFDRHPAFARALDIRLPDEVERIKAIYGNTTDDDWDDARARTSAADWGIAS